jgi:hypothetical protein
MRSISEEMRQLVGQFGSPGNDADKKALAEKIKSLGDRTKELLQKRAPCLSSSTSGNQLQENQKSLADVKRKADAAAASAAAASSSMPQLPDFTPPPPPVSSSSDMPPSDSGRTPEQKAAAVATLNAELELSPPGTPIDRGG